MISPTGNEALIVMAINQELIAPYFSIEILAEYSDVLLRPRFGFPSDEVGAVLAWMRRVGHLLNPTSVERVSPDPDDDKFIACAFEGKADFLVPGNTRHFPKPDLKG